MTEEERKEEVKRLQKEFKDNAKDFQNQAKGKIENKGCLAFVLELLALSFLRLPVRREVTLQSIVLQGMGLPGCRAAYQRGSHGPVHPPSPTASNNFPPPSTHKSYIICT